MAQQRCEKWQSGTWIGVNSWRSEWQGERSRWNVPYGAYQWKALTTGEWNSVVRRWSFAFIRENTIRERGFALFRLGDSTSKHLPVPPLVITVTKSVLALHTPLAGVAGGAVANLKLRLPPRTEQDDECTVILDHCGVSTKARHRRLKTPLNVGKKNALNIWIYKMYYSQEVWDIWLSGGNCKKVHAMLISHESRTSK